MEYVAKENILCLSRDEAQDLYKRAKQRDIRTEIARRGLSLSDLQGDREAMEEISNTIVSQGIRDSKDSEFFMAAFCFPKFFSAGDDRVCFPLKRGYDPRGKPPADFSQLLEVTDVDNRDDFLIMSKDGFRAFQMKRYRGPLTTEALAGFIHAKLDGYGGDLGKTNLLVVLQSPGDNLTLVDFEEVGRLVEAKRPRSCGEILVDYNEDNRSDVLIRVWPGGVLENWLPGGPMP